MHFSEFLNRVIDDGIAAAREDYAKPAQKRKLEGSIAGFEACRNVRPLHAHQDLTELLDAARTSTHAASLGDEREDYWWFRCYELEVEWICNCVSAVLINEGKPPIITPTARGVLKAADIIGVRAS